MNTVINAMLSFFEKPPLGLPTICEPSELETTVPLFYAHDTSCGPNRSDRWYAQATTLVLAEKNMLGS